MLIFRISKIKPLGKFTGLLALTPRAIAFVSKVYEKEVVEDTEPLVFTMT